MKITSYFFAFILIFTLFVSANPLHAQKELSSERLAKALKLFPDADEDKDGILTVPEATRYLDKHPELKAMLGPRGNEANKSGSDATTSDSKGTRVFVCAHSFMIFTAALLPPMAKDAEVAYVNAGQQMIGGSKTLQHWELPDDKNKAKAALREGKVDVLTLSPHKMIPDVGIDNFTKLGLEKNPKIRVLIQASWPARDGVEGEFKNAMRDNATVESVREMSKRHHSDWISKLEKQVRDLNTSVGSETAYIVPVCDAVSALREKIAEGTAPGLKKQTDLFRDDLGHPQAPLAMLVTYCHFCAIYHRSPVGLPVPSALSSLPEANSMNLLLQQIAWDAVSKYPMSGVKTEKP